MLKLTTAYECELGIAFGPFNPRPELFLKIFSRDNSTQFRAAPIAAAPPANPLSCDTSTQKNVYLTLHLRQQPQILPPHPLAIAFAAAARKAFFYWAKAPIQALFDRALMAPVYSRQQR
ncbi:MULTISPECIES: hypothetical protein [Rhodobacter]|uniref:hypothetical protein n=1 Tax=Rhodobacter TaxID=1060 RepID=UPI00148230B3|nr:MULTISPECIES: hypothetical protein [Rhodobacter]